MRRVDLRPSRPVRPLPARGRRPPDDPHAWGLRRVEREVNKWLCRNVHPWIPGLALPYDMQITRQLTVSEADVPVRSLASALDGTSVLLLTDIHTGPFLSPPALGAVFDRLATLAPDLVLFGGDLTTASTDDFVRFAPAFRALAASARLGAFAVLGNHDHYGHEAARLRDLVLGCGIRVLHNTCEKVSNGGGELLLAGLDDWRHGLPDLDAALAEAARLAAAANGRGPLPILLLSHHPDVFFEAVRQGVALVLAGHTHGGQIRLPGRRAPMMRMSMHGLDEGLFHLEESRLVVSRGLGVTGLPLRLGCSPEAVFVRLRVG